MGIINKSLSALLVLTLALGMTFGWAAVAAAAWASAVTIDGTVDEEIAPQEVTIQSFGFNDISKDTIVTSWFTNLPAGLIATISEDVSGTFIHITITGTPLEGSDAPMEITIPKEYFFAQDSDVIVDPDPDACFAIREARIGDVTVGGDQNGPLAPKDVVITLTADSLATPVTAGDNLASWFTNLPAGLTALSKNNVNAGDTAVTITIAGTPSADINAPVAITIPAEKLESNTVLSASPNPCAIFLIGHYASSGAVTINGSRNVPIVPKDVVITLTGDSLAAKITAGDKLAGWFTNLPGGLSAVAKNDAAAGDAAVTITLSGRPSAALQAPMTVTIPAANLASHASLPVSLNPNAKFDIGTLTNKLISTTVENNVLLIGDYAFDLSAAAAVNGYNLNNFIKAAKTVDDVSGSNQVYFMYNGKWYDLVADENLTAPIGDPSTMNNGTGTYQYWNMND